MNRLSLRLAIVLGTLCVVSLGFPLWGQNTPTDPNTPNASGGPPVEEKTEGGSPAEEKATPPSQADDPAAAKHPETYLEFAMAGGYLMIPIGLCSILLFAFLAERLVAVRRGRVLPPPFIQGVNELAKHEAVDHGRVEALCKAHPSSAARIIRSALEKIEQPRDEIEQIVNNSAQREIHSLRRYVGLFAVIAAVTPLLGLLGTVTGMIQAFREVAVQGLGSGQALAPGIYKALVTTAGGLLVAIPALIVYHWFISRIDNYIHELDNLVVDFVDANRQNTNPTAK